MGIKKLLKFVSGACRNSHISEFAGKAIGIDMSCLIYKGLYNGDYIKYIRLYIDRLTRMKCKLVLVFDGKAPETKAAEMEARARLREQQPKADDEPMDITTATAILGKKKKKTRTMCITKEIVAKVKKKFAKQWNVEIIHAPGESDPQLAFLLRDRHVRAIVTDDSDLIVYGCQRIIFKLNPRGQCLVYERKKLDPQIEWPMFRYSLFFEYTL